MRTRDRPGAESAVSLRIAALVLLAPGLAGLAGLAGLGCDGGGGLGSGGTVATGDPCSSDGDCLGAHCLLTFPGGSCSSDCAQTQCGPGEVCQMVAGSADCLKGCTAGSDCRGGYMCQGGACVPACTVDGDCPHGLGCKSGNCISLPGTPTGGACATDAECSSRDCDLKSKTCQVACTREGACGAGLTCYINPVDTDGNGSTDALRPICIAVRKGLPLAAVCKADTDCAVGQCELGRCTTLCETIGDCGGTGNGCYGMYAQIDDGAPKMKGCIPRRGVIEWNMGANGAGPVGVPENAISLSLFVEAPSENVADYAGLLDITDPAGNLINSYATDFHKNALRYQAAEGASMALVSNSPLVAFSPNGVYTFSPFAQTKGGAPLDWNLRARIKLYDQPKFTSGNVSLHVFVTNLAGGCKSFTASSAPGLLGPWEAKLRSIYKQAGINIDEIKYIDSAAPSSFTAAYAGLSTELDNVLKTATTPDSPGSLELVIVKRIVATGTNLEILGIAGGIPNPTGIPGTAHSGATVSISTLCSDPSQKSFATTAAHELGHTLGLFHNIEMDKTTDQMSDTQQQGTANLMYWAEGDVAQGLISAQQTAAILMNPVIRP